MWEMLDVLKICWASNVLAARFLKLVPLLVEVLRWLYLDWRIGCFIHFLLSADILLFCSDTLGDEPSGILCTLVGGRNSVCCCTMGRKISFTVKNSG